MRILSTLACLIFSTFATAEVETHVTGKVTQILTHTKARNPYDVTKMGVVFLYIENLPGACETNTKRVAITSDHPLFEIVSSIALSAQAQDKNVLIGYLEACTQNSSAWDFSYIRIYQ